MKHADVHKKHSAAGTEHTTQVKAVTILKPCECCGFEATPAAYCRQRVPPPKLIPGPRGYSGAPVGSVSIEATTGTAGTYAEPGLGHDTQREADGAQDDRRGEDGGFIGGIPRLLRQMADTGTLAP